MEQNFAIGEQRVVVTAGRADVVVAGNVLRGKDHDHPRCGMDGVEIQSGDTRMGMLCAAHIQMQQIGWRIDIVHISGAAGDMFDAAVVAMAQTDSHAAPR